LAYFLRSNEFLNFANTVVAGAKMPRMVMSEFWQYKIPLPPLAEQRRIAAILDQADALRSKRRESLTQLETLKQSIFLDMFGQNKNHPRQTLEELCELITDGTHQTPTYADEGVIFLSAKNVTTGSIDWLNVKFIPNFLHKELHRRLAPQKDDILLAKNGTTGVAAIVDRECVFDIYVSLALLRPRQGILASYLHAAINSAICRSQFNSSLKGIGVPNLHLKEIRLTKVPVPTMKQQQQFALHIHEIESLRKQHETSLNISNSLFASLQHRAFRGEL
jgi:type I restriction enzyme S subunit